MEMQNCVEGYRMQLQEFYNWLDSLVKRAENCDRGHGQKISQRLTLVEQLVSDSNQGKGKLHALSKEVCY